MSLSMTYFSVLVLCFYIIVPSQRWSTEENCLFAASSYKAWNWSGARRVSAASPPLDGTMEKVIQPRSFFSKGQKVECCSVKRCSSVLTADRCKKMKVFTLTFRSWLWHSGAAAVSHGEWFLGAIITAFISLDPEWRSEGLLPVCEPLLNQ